MNLRYQSWLGPATLYFAAVAATTMLLQQPCGAQNANTAGAEKSDISENTSREDAIALAKLWTALEGEWQYKQQSDAFGFLMLDLTFKKTCEEVKFYQDSTERQFPGQLSGVVLYLVTQVRPIRNDLNSYYMQASLDGKRLVLKGRDSITEEAITIEILDADKIDTQTTQIMLRIKKIGGGNFLWYRSGTLLEYTRQPAEKPNEKEPLAPTPAKVKRSPATFP